ncbi:MAG: hypothetical protein KDB10_23040 [Acidimicrobiales bacterium]|nr:hypothetical protein [Acidimicrobiales bacterium]
MDQPQEIEVRDCGDGTPGVLRRVQGDEYELYDRTGARREQCTPGDSMYIEPYRYACVGGRWVRQEPPVR